MKIVNLLFLLIGFMQLSTLVNVTLFNGEWSGIVLWVHTLLFLMALGAFMDSKRTLKKARR